jgi:hypothetical protein
LTDESEARCFNESDLAVPYGFHTCLYHVMNYQIVTIELIA